MIDKDFLAVLRKQHLPALILTMVQLEQRCPGWWPDQAALAEEMGTDHKMLNVWMNKLHALGLIAKYSVAGRGAGTWLWWVKKHEKDKPSVAPHWRIRDINTQTLAKIDLGDGKGWSKRHNISHAAVRSFLIGDTKILAGRYQLVSAPLDCIADPNEVVID